MATAAQPEASPESAPVLAGLLGLGAPGAATVRATHALALEASAQEALRAWATRSGGLADTPLVAAWMLLAGRWSGVAAQRGSTVGESAASFTATLSAEAGAHDWLSTVDAARRAAAPQGPEAEWAWAGVSAAAAPAAALVVFRTRAADAQAVPTELVADLAAEIPAALASLLLARIAAVAQQLCANPTSPLGAIDLLGDDARARLLQPVPHVGRDPAATVHGAFTRQAAGHPDAIALRHLDEHLTYGQLEARSSRLAQHLRARGVGPGTLVGVALDRSTTAIVTLLAVLKAGGCYLPLDPAYPRERIAFMLGDARAVLVVTSPDKAAAFDATVPVLALDGADLPAPDAAEPVPAGGASRDVAYVMYTSGSTGTPKGVQIPHDAILRLVQGAGYVHLGADTVMLHAAPLGFDASTLEIWGPLLNGGCCVLHPEDLPTPAGLAATIQGARVTTAWLTAALFNAVVDDDPRQLGGLRELLIGGEALSVAHVRRLQDAVPDVTVINGYGPTESTTFATTWRIPRPLAANARSVPIGKAITDTQTLILGPAMELLPAGLVGKLYVGGRGLALGYLNRPELTAERFVAHPFAPGERLYDTGDLVRMLPGGEIDFIGRADQQVKIRGFRIELGEIESALAEHPAVQAAAVLAWRNESGDASLAAYLVARPGADVPSAGEQRAALARTLPEFMLPSTFTWLARFPITVNGKLDRAALPRPVPARSELLGPYQAPQGAVEERICAVFAEVLGIEGVGRGDNFFELGGNSLQVLKALGRLARQGVAGLSATMFFRQPTAQALARALADAAAPSGTPRPAAAAAARTDDEPIAIIAVAGRFPGAADVETFWDNLCAGRDGITHFGPGELDPSLDVELVDDPSYVRARGIVDDVDLFDPAFFGISPREAELMDPQQRVFMELCWECLERGGHAPDAAAMPIGVFGGMNNATYFRNHIQPRPDLIEKLGEFAVMLGNEKDYIATRTAYRLNLTGPAVSIHTACSTSLVAIAQAFWSLRNGDCRMALAGGVAITCPPRSGYLYQAGSMLSPDGRTRSFDAQSEGTVFSDGAAVVLLKRLSDALADGDDVIALIRGVGTNNDGRDKASFTAPSIEGQVAVIARAQEVAGIDPRTISYVEAHGTATPIGDPVEVEALTQAFRRATADTGFCVLGSVKSNVGHTVMAAGAAGVIKTALALAHERLPGTIHYTRANPAIDFAASPFVVSARLQAWPRGAAPRRAGVSSFGVGGTNAHAVLEEAPLRAPSSPARGPQRLQLSARSAPALEVMTARLAAHLEAEPALNLADVAFTLQHGRTPFAHRCAVVADNAADAVAALRTAGHAARRQGAIGARAPALLWLFPGQGAQYPGMGRALAAADPAFGAAFAEALAAVLPALSFDLAARLDDASPDALRATEATQPALFCIEYALARAWQARGLVPAALIGHSVGEFAAAVIAGVMSLADAARLVARRGALLQALPAGAMLSVRLPLSEVQARMPADVFLAAENGPQACVVAGESAAIDAWASALEAAGVGARRLVTSHAFHSPMMDAAVAPFEALVREVALSTPLIPIVSTATGQWLTDAQAVDPAYWSRQLREPVRFSRALRTALERHADALALELGPRDSLSTLVRQHGAGAPAAVGSLGDTPALEAQRLALADAQLWTRGIATTTAAASPADDRRRVRLPTYAFERRRCWVDAAVRGTAPAPVAVPVPVPVPLQAAAIPVADSTTSAPAAIAAPEFTTSTTSTAMPTPSAPNSRRPALIERLRDLFGDVAGLDLAQADPSAPFVEFGIDSLILTQVAMQTKKRFGVAVTFRQLSESCRSFDALAAFLDEAMPPEAAPATAAPVAVVPAAAAAPVAAAATASVAAVPFVMPQGAAPAGSFVQQVIQQQMALMAQQLAVLGGAAPAAPVAVAAPIAVVAVPAPTQVAAAAAPVAAPAGEETAGKETMRYDVKKAFGAIARIHTQAAPVTARQQSRLEAFMRRYVERTARSKAYTTTHRPHLADPRVVNGFRPLTKEITYQIVIERSKGSRLWDIDGNEYVDVLNGFGMCMFGWQPDFVQEAVRQQLELGYEIGPQHPLAGEVADLVCEMTGADRAGLCNTGSEAVMAAIRIARTVTCRNTIVVFTGSYHGTFDEVLVRAGRNHKGIPAAPGIMADVFDDVRVLDYGTPESLEFIRRNADDLAAVLIEPVQSRRPDFQPREYLKQIREITEASGTCMILDEVITGFRMHPGGVQAMFDIRPDLSTYGKVIGGGFPIGVVAGKREFMDALDGGPWHYGDDSVPTVGVTYFAGTFVRHPLAMAAAKASLQYLKTQGGQLQEQLNLVTAAMADELCAFCREAGVPIEIRHFGSLWRVSWLEDHPLQDLLFAMMRSRGVHILDNFPCFMTTAHTPQDIAKIKQAFKESVAELQQAEFLPARATAAVQAVDASKPPVPGARLGRGPNGEVQWYVPNPDEPGKYVVAESRG